MGLGRGWGSDEVMEVGPSQEEDRFSGGSTPNPDPFARTELSSHIPCGSCTDTSASPNVDEGANPIQFSISASGMSLAPSQCLDHVLPYHGAALWLYWSRKLE